MDRKTGVATLTIAAIGVVYGDIGTSPLYTLKEVFHPERGLPLTETNLLGAVSLILWGLTIIVSLKYVTLVLRADNGGEGGIMALVALALSSVAQNSRWRPVLTIVGLTGAALFFGDGVITPAISVLSAIEGLEVATPAFKPYVVPITVAVLVLLYALQRRGTSGVGKWFGPVMTVWFAALAAMGVVNIAGHPAILAALNPLLALDFMLANGWLAFVALGAIVLAFTGAEALYADMGHFGKRPIRMAWFTVVFPGLALNYLGQGALLLSTPEAVSNPFYQQLGLWSVYPLVALSTVATVIASQATISGTFSIVHQAISLGYLPRMHVVYTSERAIGQIYVPFVNWLQLCAVVLAVVGFGSSSHLASAYGIAVTATMLMTTILTFFVIRYGWHYPAPLAWFATGFFLVIDLTLFSANTLKLLHGGWFPIVLAAAVVIVMATWEKGRSLVYQSLRRDSVPLQDFLDTLFMGEPTRVPGAAVFFRADGDGVPNALLHNLMHNKILHETTVFLTIRHLTIPRADAANRVCVENLGHGCYQVDVRYGFMDEKDIPAALAQCAKCGLVLEPMSTSYFIARQNIIARAGDGMALWREHMYSTMARNARDAADYYRIPANRVIEVGTQIEI